MAQVEPSATKAPASMDMEMPLDPEKPQPAPTLYKNRRFIGLLTEAPYFPEPPRVKDPDSTERTFLETIKETVINPADVDGHYGYTDNELLPLPFKVPKMWEYFVDVAANIFTVAQATVVMFISIMVDNDYRAVRFGTSYSSIWLPIARAVIVLYPLCTMLILVTLFLEYACRKFMYYRLLSMRILVDWANPILYKSWFFFYFIATWVLLNCWCLYGVVKLWDYDGEHFGADTVSFTTWIVVNLQTMQIFLAYMRLLSSESRLVSLNQVFETDPVEAQALLQYTYVIEEEDLIEECRQYGKVTERLMFARLIHILTCCMAFKNILDMSDAHPAKFDLERLRDKAPNKEVVEEEIEQLRQSMIASRRQKSSGRFNNSGGASAGNGNGTSKAGGGGSGGATHVEEVKVEMAEGSAAAGDKAEGAAAAADSTQGADGSEAPGGAAAAGAAAATNGGQGVNGGPRAVAEGTEAVPSGGAANAVGGVAVDSAAAADGMERGAVPVETEEDEVRKKGWFGRLMHGIHWAVYRRLYASIHCFYVALIPATKSWPYRPDVPCFRMLIIIEMISYLCVGGIVVFGVLRATISNRCDDGNKTCQACQLFMDQFGGSNELCYNQTEYTISRVLFPSSAPVFSLG